MLILLLAAPALAQPPAQPSVEDGPVGQPGGTLHILIANPRDTRQLPVFGYARLVAYRPDYTIVPDILLAVEVEADRIYTMHLRPGHKWSDGEPFTSEDFRYWWEDVALNPQLTPAGPPVALLRDGEAPKVEILDDLTVRYSWSKPMPSFLAELAGPTPVVIYRRALSETVPRPLRRSEASGGSGRGPASEELGGAAQPARQSDRGDQSGSALARSLGPEDPAAGRALRLRPQSLLLPGRQ
ncbi:MAG: ABC transporter substrate-binding protein [Aliidongia sp.]